MSKTARFQSAVSRARPAGSRVIEAYSLKLGRRLQCFGEAAFEQWIRLEVDPTIQTFCERPLDLNFADGVLRVDFWVRQGDREMLLVMGDACEARRTIIDDVEMAVRVVSPAELSASKMWTDNWQRMLVAITCSGREMPASLQQSVLKFVGEPMQLSRIEQEFSTGDPTPVRAAVFCLLHAGKLQAPQLWPSVRRIAARFAAAQAPIEQEGAHRRHSAAMELFYVFLIVSNDAGDGNRCRFSAPKR